jgi:hypothetical protein
LALLSSYFLTWKTFGLKTRNWTQLKCYTPELSDAINEREAKRRSADIQQLAAKRSEKRKDE